MFSEVYHNSQSSLAEIRVEIGEKGSTNTLRKARKNVNLRKFKASTKTNFIVSKIIELMFDLIKKTFWKMVVTSIFPLLPQCFQNSLLLGYLKVLTVCRKVKHLHIFLESNEFTILEC